MRHIDPKYREPLKARRRRSQQAQSLARGSTEHLAKREGATGSLAIVVSGDGPSHPRSLHHGSRLPAMSRRGAARLVILVRDRALPSIDAAGAYISFQIATQPQRTGLCEHRKRREKCFHP